MMWRERCAPLFKPSPLAAPIMLSIFSSLDEDKLIDPLRGWKMSQGGAERKTAGRGLREICAVLFSLLQDTGPTQDSYIYCCVKEQIQKHIKIKFCLLWLENQNVLNSLEVYFLLCVFFSIGHLFQRERERERGREGERQRERQTETERETERARERQRERQMERERQRERWSHIYSHIQKRRAKRLTLSSSCPMRLLGD